MHSTTGESITFFHNGDFSGLVQFTAPRVDTGRPQEFAAPFSALARAVVDVSRESLVEIDARVDRDSSAPSGGEQAARALLPAADLRVLVAERMRNERIAWLESLDSEELFALAQESALGEYAAEGSE